MLSSVSGPTPDDVTMPGIAEGFRVNLHRDPQLEQAIRAQTDTHHQPYLVMASIPDGSQLHFVAGQPFPIVSFRYLPNILYGQCFCRHRYGFVITETSIFCLGFLDWSVKSSRR